MNNKMVREIGGAKIIPKSSFKNYDVQNTRGRKLREKIRYSYVSLCSINTSKYRCHYVQTYLSNFKPHFPMDCVSYDITISSHNPLHSSSRVVVVMETLCVFCEVKT